MFNLLWDFYITAAVLPLVPISSNFVKPYLLAPDLLPLQMIQKNIMIIDIELIREPVGLLLEQVGGLEDI